MVLKPRAVHTFTSITVNPRLIFSHFVAFRKLFLR